MDKMQALAVIDSKKDWLDHLGDQVWDCAETAFQEFGSMKILCDALAEAGFEVAQNVGDVPTAFTGRYGSGKPVIGFLGEFDALSGLNQKACCTSKEAFQAGAPGHGCGHNNLGVGSLGAAIAVKEYLSANNLPGTVIYYGCPGEEGGSGKAFMAREGVFDELDIALTWHPGDINCVASGSSLANYQVSYKFKGISAHAAGCPHLGRSALDAVELMNVAVNFLREHVIPEARMHYAITNSGGFSPNVVQAEAEVLYLLRAPKTPQVAEIYDRVNDIAKGAALMTSTQLETRFIKACSNVVPNNVLERLMHKNLSELPLPTYTDEEMAFAKSIRESVENLSNTLESKADKYGIEGKRLAKEHKDDIINNFVVPYVPDETAMPGSTDVGDVSWVCPTAQVNTATWASGTPGHSWQVVAQGKSELAHKGTVLAAKVMAATAIDTILDPSIIEAAKEELNDRLEGGKYVCPIPKGVKPAAINPGK